MLFPQSTLLLIVHNCYLKALKAGFDHFQQVGFLILLKELSARPKLEKNQAALSQLLPL